MSLNLPALTGANTILQLVYDLNQVKVVAANTTSPIFSGNVGIGGSNPQGKLQIGDLSSGSSEPTYHGDLILHSAASTLAATGGIEWKTSTFGSGYGWKIDSIDSSGVHLVFGTRQNSATWTEVARIDSSGNMSVGSRTPTAKLHLSPPAATTGANVAIRIDNSGSSDGSPNALLMGIEGSIFNGEAYIDTAYSGVASVTPLKIKINGTETVRIDSSGSLGIGTSSPSTYATKLAVKNSSNGVENYQSGNWAAAIYNAQDAADYNGLIVGNRWQSHTSTVFEVGSLFGGGSAWHQFYKIDGIGQNFWSISGSEVMRLNSSGNLLVGTTTGYGKFAVSGTDSVATAFITGTTNLVRIIPDSGYNTIESTNLAQSAFAPMRVGGSSILLHTGGTDRVTIDSSGNVGIGTSSPNYPLDIFKTSAGAITTALNLRNDDATTGTGVQLAFTAFNNNTLTAAITNVRDGAGTYSLRFSNWDGANNTERMRIDSSGNVGIGTSSPSGSLHISTSSPQIYLTDTDTGGDSRISAGSSAGSLFFDADINNEVASSIIQFSIDGTERARIDGNGLRIGATAEVVTSPGGELLSLQGTATKSPLAVKSSDVTSIHSWNTGDSSAIRYHFIGWNPAGNQEIHLRRETDASISLTSNQAKLNLSGAGDGIDILSNMRMNDYTLTTPILKDYGETSTSPSSSSGTLTLDISNGNNFQVTLTENISAITISNPTASGNVCSISVRFVQGASAYTVAWPASFKWAGGSAGSVSTGNGDIDILTAITWDGGTTWYAVLNNDFS